MSEVNKQEDQLMVQIRNMNKWYGDFHVLKNINLDVRRGEKSLSVALQVPVNQP